MNNFDTPSKGVNLDLSVFLDTDLAQIYFDENFTQISKGWGLRNTGSKWLFTDSGRIGLDDTYNVSKTLEITGYCQGDCATIVIPTNCGFKRGFDWREYLENLFYNQPTSATLEIEGEDFDLMEEIDPYEYDKQKVLESAKNRLTHEKKDYILSWLSENLPEFPECQH